MTMNELALKAEKYLEHLCVSLPNRRVGSVGNRAATDFFAEAIELFGFEVECPSFDCIDWRENGADLAAGEQRFAALVGPYSLGCDVCGPLVVVETAAELAAAELRGRVLLLRGEITREQLMPKNFVFYNPEAHQRIVALLEEKQPLAVIAATTQDVSLAGAVSPFPLIEDGDFDIPSAYLSAAEGEKLAAYAGKEVSLVMEAERRPAAGCNVVARKGDPERRVVFFAHIDAKDGTPGALDNGTGVVILLLLAELLADYDGRLGLEIVALNGEDYYAASGEMAYLVQNEGKFPEIILGINMDGVGYAEGSTAYSLYGCPSDVEKGIRETFAHFDGLVEGEQWYQSDHGLFLMHGRPALALTSDQFTALWTEIAHTPRDTPAIVDPHKLVEVAQALQALLGHQLFAVR